MRADDHPRCLAEEAGGITWVSCLDENNITEGKRIEVLIALLLLGLTASVAATVLRAMLGGAVGEVTFQNRVAQLASHLSKTASHQTSRRLWWGWACEPYVSNAALANELWAALQKMVEKGGPSATRSVVRVAASQPKSTPAPTPRVCRSAL